MTIKQILAEHQKGKEYKHLVPGPKYPIWLDTKNIVLAFPPIINGIDTAITTKTKNLFIDVTGTDKKVVEQAINIIAATLADSGAILYSVNVNGKESPNLKPKEMKVSVEYINSLLGLQLNAAEIAKLLVKMGHSATTRKDSLEIQIPCYRTDILHPFDVA